MVPAKSLRTRCCVPLGLCLQQLAPVEAGYRERPRTAHQFSGNASDLARLGMGALTGAQEPSASHGPSHD